jgi:hypothetical protein
LGRLKQKIRRSKEKTGDQEIRRGNRRSADQKITGTNSSELLIS